jgi:ubiquinone/menaquinone biosynthesis C-methylase UbiE
MSAAGSHINEQLAGAAFSNQSIVFDELYLGDAIIQYKRRRVRNHVMQHLPKGSNILELNSGTGEDAIFFAQNGYKVHATDVSEGMQSQLKKKIEMLGLTDTVSSELCSYTRLDGLQRQGSYDLIFSNFAGLNCTGELDKVLASFLPLLKPGGAVTLVVLPKFCLWETLLVFKGKFKTAFRRFFSGNGRKAHVQGVHFTCWYYNPSYITKRLKDDFDMLTIEGLCTIVPPSYIEKFAEKYPAIYKNLTRLEDRYKAAWPWKYIGDYYIISLKKKS